MVRAIFCAVLIALGAAPAWAEPDWASAGGDLFTATTRSGAPAGAQGPEPVRLAPLSQPFTEAIDLAAARHGLDPKLLHALVAVESAYRPAVVSPAGAMGLTQLMPGTARDLGVADPFDPLANLQGGADYLARQLVRFRDVRLALAAYNSGPGRVAALGRVPTLAETQGYVRAVVECYLPDRDLVGLVRSAVAELSSTSKALADTASALSDASKHRPLRG